MQTGPNSRHLIPNWERWGALAWLFLWVPTYWIVWGPSSFVFLCDIAVILTCVGLWGESALLISTQAVSSLVVDTIWALDIASTLIAKRHLIGGTEYFFDSHYPQWVRLMSLFHVALPVILLTALNRIGYDRRALRWQAGIAAVAMIASRFVGPEKNINFAFRDPLLHKSWGVTPVYVGLMWIGLVVVVYLPTHMVLTRLLPAPQSAKS